MVWCVLQIYRKREREPRRRRVGGGGGGGGEWYIYHSTPHTHTHPPNTHTLYIMTIIYNLNEGFKHCAS